VKVLYIISNPFYYSNNPVGGSISSGSGVIKGLVDCGYSVDIISDDLMPTVEESKSIKYIFFQKLLFRRRFAETKWVISERINNFITSFLFRLVLRIALPNLLRNNSYDLVYLRASHFASDALSICNDFNIPSILEVNKPLSMQPYNKPSGFSRIEKKTTIKKIPNEIKQYEYATLISVDSTLRAKWIIDFVDKRFETKIMINHNGVDERLFSCINQAVSQNSNLVGMASSFRWYNDIDELMRIIIKVLDDKKEAQFILFVGDLSMKESIEKKILSYDLFHAVNIEYAIPLNKMPMKLSMCDVLISHFNFHGVWPHNCSIKHLEYMSLGKPVVATNVGEVNFAIEDGISGLMIKEGDERGFADSILRLLKDKDYSKKLGENGRKKVLENHTWKKHVEKSLKKLKEKL